MRPALLLWVTTSVFGQPGGCPGVQLHVLLEAQSKCSVLSPFCSFFFPYGAQIKTRIKSKVIFFPESFQNVFFMPLAFPFTTWMS